MIAIVDYGVGNIFSLKSSLEFLGETPVVSGDTEELRRADKIILPGVGAFGDARQKLRERGLDATIISEAKNGKPLLGICLGMQLLYERSYEYGEHGGLGLVKGEVIALADTISGEGIKIPHMGWNDLLITRENALLRYVKSGEFVYYVHSFYVPRSDATIGESHYGSAKITGAVESGNVYGTQFHPEKSGDTGLRILKGFCEL